MKVGFPSANDCPASEFSRMDFDSDEEFMVFYTSEFKWYVRHMQLKIAVVLKFFFTTLQIKERVCRIDGANRRLWVMSEYGSRI